MKSILHSMSAPILGYVLIVIAALVFQDALFGRVTHASSLFAITIGGGLTALACIGAGYFVAWYAPHSPTLHVLPLALWLGIETTLLHLRGGSPLWFDVMAGGSNVVGVLLGLWARRQVVVSRLV